MRLHKPDVSKLLHIFFNLLKGPGASYLVLKLGNSLPINN